MTTDASSLPTETVSFRDRAAAAYPRSAVLRIGAVLIVLAVTSLDGVVPPIGIPLALATIAALLWLTRQSWREVGLRRPDSWPRTIALGVGTAVVLQLFAVFVLMPLLGWLGVPPPDYSSFEAVRGNVGMLVTFLIVSWTTAGFGEEVIARGFLMGQFAALAGGSRRSWFISLLTVSVLFGLAHAYQGPVGMAMTGFAGLVLGALYLACGRNLWPAVIAHGTTDTISFLVLYFGLITT